MATPLFETERAKGRTAFKLYFASMFVGIGLIFFYRATNVPESREGGRWAWMGMFGAELWFGFYWILTQSVRWNPIYRRTFKERLQQRYESELPGVDIFVCTADPAGEPPTLVISTVLSVLAYNYPAHKMTVYISDDAGSELTFYALWEMSRFTKHWLPFCRRFKVEPRSPAAYFSRSHDPHDPCNPKDWSSMKILIDSKDEGAIDIDGNQLPSLVYMAREKRPQHNHNFKAGAMNALIRVSSEISDNPIILNVDCDMYSNNSESIRDALCFFLDEDKGHEIGFVQFPQYFNNITKNDLYANSLNVINSVEMHGCDSWGGPMYIGTGCFHRRQSLCGEKYSNMYKEDWNRATMRNKDQESPSILEERAMALATCIYEQNTQWGKEIGLKYGCPAEDIITGLSIHYRGWKSICFDPARRGFLGIAPTTLAQTLVQHKRWAEGNLQIFASKFCPLLFGHGKITLGHQMGYSVFGLWAANSFPSLYYLAVPSLFLLKGITLFPKVSSLWFIPFVYVTLAKQAYSLFEALLWGDTLIGWWNTQRMWVFKRLVSYFFAIINTISNIIGASQMAFTLTTKVTDGDVSKRYEQEIIEFGASSPWFTIISTYALLNFVCFVGGVKRVVVNEADDGFDPLLLQLMLCGSMVLLNAPIYNALFLRKDKGSMSNNVIFASFGFVILACLVPII